MIHLLDPQRHYSQLLVYDESNWPAFCLTWTKTATRSIFQSEPHPLMMNVVATGTLVSTSIGYGMISSIYIRVSHHLVRDWLVTTGLPADMVITMVTTSRSPKELTGVSGRGVWSDSVHLINMVFWFCIHPLLIQGSDNVGKQDHHHMREDKIFRW